MAEQKLRYDAKPAEWRRARQRGADYFLLACPCIWIKALS